ncbi:hypothetical protein [Nocardia wallacei]|uniref:hypothetical protein n=1 Tax=Nocardia wallacei TaxID=480035 RepID=UPI00245559FB|nr:hypothetical protein [Nocardia wallacei]
MRTSFTRAALIPCGLMVVVAALTGCSDNDSGTGAASPTAPAAAQADPAAVKAITDAYTTLFDAAAPVEQRAAAVEKGQDFVPVLQAQAANPQAQGTTATVSVVDVIDATRADVTYTLLMGGNPVLPDQHGQAVKDGERWKVAAMTFCALATLQGGAIAAC